MINSTQLATGSGGPGINERRRSVDDMGILNSKTGRYYQYGQGSYTETAATVRPGDRGRRDEALVGEARGTGRVSSEARAGTN